MKNLLILGALAACLSSCALKPGQARGLFGLPYTPSRYPGLAYMGPPAVGGDSTFDRTMGSFYNARNMALGGGPVYTAPPKTPTQSGTHYLDESLAAVRPASQFSGSRYDPNSLSNPYGAGSPYKADGLMNPYSRYGSKYSNESWTNPYATNAPKLVDENGKYLGRFSTNKYDPDSTSNPYGRFGSKYSSESINNPYGQYGNPYGPKPVYVVPQR